MGSTRVQTDEEKAAEWDRNWQAKQLAGAQSRDPDAARIYAILGINTALFGIVLASGFIIANTLAAACVLGVSGIIGGTWGGFSAETEFGRVSQRMGIVLFVLGLVLGIVSVVVLLNRVPLRP